MPWFYVDDGFSNSKPVMNLDARIRNEAIGLWVRCGAWSAKEETDGHVPMDIVKQFNGRPAVIRALRDDAELWARIEPESCRNPREILFNSWEKWQKTRAENQARRKLEAEKKRTWRSGKKGRDYVPASEVSEMSTGDNMVDNQYGSEFVSTGESRDPDPTRPDPTHIPLVDLGGGVTQVAATGPRPECHEHSENYDGPCRKCKRRRKWDEANVGVVAAAEVDRKRALKALRENCPRCHGTNTYEDETGVHTCSPHIEAVRHA